MGAVRASYTGPAGAARIVRAAGGLAAWCRATFDLPRVAEPGPGDLVLIAAGRPWGAAMAICIRPGEVAGKSAAGLVVLTKPTILEAWTCRNF